MPKEAAFDSVALIKSRNVIGDTLSVGQECFLRCLYGLKLDAEMHDIYVRATGNSVYNAREYREAVAICGRRSGKSSRLAANIAVVEAVFRKHELATGERGWVVLVAPTKRQARVCFQYILARLEHSPSMRAMIAGEPRDGEVDLTNGISICVLAANYRWVRGFSCVCCILDEEAFFYDDVTCSNPASEILRALRPGMASFPNAKLIRISSPFAKIGNLWESYRDREKHPEVLTWKLDSKTMNPSLDAAFLAAEQARDPEAYEREYGGEFYESASMFLPAQAVEECVMRGRFEMLAQPGMGYFASLDAAFRGDHFGWCLVHRVADRVVVDVIRSKRGSRASPVNLAATLGEIVATLRAFGVGKIHGDSFCAEPIRQALKVQGITFEQVTTLGTKSAPLWGTLRALVSERKIELLDDEETTAQLKKLQLIATHSGNQRVEATSGHDDKSVCLALASHMAMSQVQRRPFVMCLDGGYEAREAAFQARRGRG
jgi:hypothetical protein